MTHEVLQIDMEESWSWLRDNNALVKIYQKYNKTTTHSNQTNLLPDTVDEYMTSTIGRCTLLPEWDTLSEVLKARNDLGLRAEWIQSHQDDKPLFHKLEFKVQLNILADKELMAQHKLFHT